ncbi:MAG: FmdB family zinc ribbon protein [bacterium]
MPIYEYICNSCANEFEKIVLTSSPHIICPRCGSGKIHKKVSTFAFTSSRSSSGPSGAGSSSCSTCVSKNCSQCGQ